MGEVAAAQPCRNALLPGGASHFKIYPLKPCAKWQCNVLRVEKRLRVMKVEAQMVNPSTYSSRISTDIPLYEIPGASFDVYLEDKPRVFKAIFPDKRRSQQLNEIIVFVLTRTFGRCVDQVRTEHLVDKQNTFTLTTESHYQNQDGKGLLGMELREKSDLQEEWRVHMLPIEFLFLTVSPVIDMRLRCKSCGKGYPPGVPQDISKIRWELQGLDDMLKPSQFSLGVKGALYPDRRGPRSRLKGQLQMSISFVLPPMLALVPEDIRRDVAESVLKRLVENMKDKVNGSLIADYSEFKREKPKALA
ncbi:hypothetical protein Sango_1784600 [Sesamum angolense]|uniref:Uncharacterized protein n=1 Tax=Sesamum angolense TaxID=2727404 RepID=A0AAE2BPR7_9LAMI|nr:hypothetical protein Sango_1784600 [Sesamum angolense]